MDDNRSASMSEALRLVREGRLDEATALLQRGLIAGLPGPGATLPSAAKLPFGRAHRVKEMLDKVRSAAAGLSGLLGNPPSGGSREGHGQAAAAPGGKR